MVLPTIALPPPWLNDESTNTASGLDSAVTFSTAFGAPATGLPFIERATVAYAGTATVAVHLSGVQEVKLTDSVAIWPRWESSRYILPVTDCSAGFSNVTVTVL